MTLKSGEEAFTIKLGCGTTIRAVYASQVKALQVKHEAADIIPANFEVKAQDVSFKAKIKIGTEECITGMKGKQFPVISNACTTGHKLQGCTCSAILVNEWYYGSNWPYVVLSRVKTMAGLHIVHALDEDLSKYAMPEEMTRMLDAFRSTIALSDISDDEYEDLLGQTQHFSSVPTGSPANRRTQQPTTGTVTP